MNMVGMLVTGVLSVAVIAEGAYIVKTNRQMSALTEQVQQLAAESVLEEAPRRAEPRPFRVGEGPTAATPTANRPPPPRFVTPPSAGSPAFAPAPSPPASGGALPLPPVLDTPEARQQLRGFIAAELEREREGRREEMRANREQDMQRRMEATIKALDLSPDVGKRLAEVMTQTQDARRDFREKVQAGQIQRGDVPRELAAMREQSEKQIRALIGDDKMQKFQELQRQNNRGPAPGGWGFGGPGAGGPPPPPGGQP
jgi:hypothetical protein